jgi:hypothetical protein
MREAASTGSLKGFIHSAPAFCPFSGPILRAKRYLGDVCAWLVRRGSCEDLTELHTSVGITSLDPYVSALSTAQDLEEILRAVKHDIAAMEARIERMARI